MSLIGDALELMHAAHKHARVIRAIVHHWEDREVYGQTPQRWQEVSLERKQTSSSSTFSFPHTSAAEPPHPPRFVETTQRIWRRQPGWYWRIEGVGTTDPDVLILSDNKYWKKEPGGPFETNVAADGSLTNGGFGFGGESFLRLLFDPASLLPVLDISEARSGPYVDRHAIHLTALARLDVDLVHVDWNYATKHLLVVDAECGILLRYEAWLDEAMYMQWDLLEVHLNEDLPDDFFTGPVDSVQIQRPDAKYTDEMSERIRASMEQIFSEYRTDIEKLEPD